METHFNQILHIRGTIRRSKYCRASYQRPGVSLSLSFSYLQPCGVHCSVYSADFFLGSRCGKTLPSMPSRMQSIMRSARECYLPMVSAFKFWKITHLDNVYSPEDKRERLNNFDKFFEILKHIAPQTVFPSPFTRFFEMYANKLIQ